MNINFIFLIFIILFLSKFLSFIIYFYISNYSRIKTSNINYQSNEFMILEIMISIIIYFNYDNLFMLINMLCLLVLSITDIKYGEISDMALIIILITILFNYSITLYPAIFCLIIGAIMSYCNLIGFGDVKLISIYALIFNYEQILLMLFLASLFALFYRHKKEQTIKFAPYLSLASYLILLSLK